MKKLLLSVFCFISAPHAAGYYDFDFYSNKPSEPQQIAERVLDYVDKGIDVISKSRPSAVLAAVKTYKLLHRSESDLNTWDIYVFTISYLQAYRQAHDMHVDIMDF